MIIRDILQRIHSAYSKGVQSDDSKITNRHIYNKLLTTRALLLYREVNKKKKLSSWNYVTLPCVEIIEVPINEECPCIPETGCSVYRSKHKLPRPITSLTNHMVRSVTSIDRKIMYTEVSMNQSKYSKGGKYSKNNNRYILQNGYIYIVAKTTPAIVTIDLLPEDIVEAYNFTNYCSKDTKDCSSKILDQEFPIDLYLLEPTIQMTFEEIVMGISRSIQDDSNNSQDNSVSNVKPQRTDQNEQQ